MAEGNSELLNSLMEMLGENPEEKISAALKSLGALEDDTSEKETIKMPPEPESGTGGELEALLKIGSLMSDVGGEDERACLLNALKPFLSEDRRPKIDSAVKMLRLARLAKAAGKSDLLKNFNL